MRALTVGLLVGFIGLEKQSIISSKVRAFLGTIWFIPYIYRSYGSYTGLTYVKRVFKASEVI